MDNTKLIAPEDKNPGEITSSGQGVRKVGNRFDGNLSAFDVTTQRPLIRSKMYDLANPTTGLVGVTFPEFARPEACKQVMERINQRQSVQYDGAAADTLSAGLGEPHWVPRYTGIAPYLPDSVGAWIAYFDRVMRWDADRNSLFADIFGGDPVDHIINVLSTAIGQPIERAVHPRFGRKMGVGLVRKGAPRPHFDFATYDVGFNATGHIGIVMVLDAGPNACQRAWNYQPEPDEFGNYDSYGDHMLDPRLTDFLDIPTPVGCLSLLCARYVHEIIDMPGRCTLAAHLVWLPDGDRWVIYA